MEGPMAEPTLNENQTIHVVGATTKKI